MLKKEMNYEQSKKEMNYEQSNLQSLYVKIIFTLIEIKLDSPIYYTN